MKTVLSVLSAIVLATSAQAEWLKRHALVSMGENTVVQADRLRKAGKFDEFRTFCDHHYCSIFPFETAIVVEELNLNQGYVKFHLTGREDVAMFALVDDLYLAK